MSIAVETIPLDFLKSGRVEATMVQGEAQSRTLRFILTQGGTPIDLTDKTVTFYMVKPDGTEYFDTATVGAETAAQGIAELTLGMQALACFGWAKTELRVVDAGGAALKSTDLQIFVRSSKSEQSLESTSEFHALDAALALAKETAGTAQQAVDTAAGLVQTADSASQSASGALAAVGNAAQSASDAAAAANSAAANASAQAEAAQTAVSAANAAAAQFDSMMNDLTAAADAEITKQMDKSGGVASYDNSVQSATFGGSTVPKSGTVLQIPAAVRDAGQISQVVFDNAEIGYSYVGSVSPDLSGAPLSQWGMIFCCASGILCAQMIFYGNNDIYSRFGFGGTFSAFSKVAMS